MSGEVRGSRSPASPSISSAISRPGTPFAHQRLVDVEVEQAHLGVGDLRQCLTVDPGELQKGDEGKARVQDRGDVAERLGVLVVELLEARGRQA